MGLRLGNAAVVALWAATASMASPTTLDAQLRPWSPVYWYALDAKRGSAYIGASAYSQQRASLIGQQGSLFELGVLGASFRSGRVMLSFEGSVVRIFDAAERFAEPSPLVESTDLTRRTDSGDFTINTHVLLTSDTSPTDALIRFGVRLPTTNDRIGLERDQTDFFATAAARHRRGMLLVDGEIGFGIHGVAGPRHNQTDPLLYGLGLGVRFRRLEAKVGLRGQYDTREHGPPRGNEHLAELAWGVRTTGATWARVELIQGLASFSPSWGVAARLGRIF